MQIIEFTDPESVACCNLASVCLPRYIVTDANNKKYFDFVQLGKVVETIVVNLNHTIDNNFYPVREAEKTNLSQRPMAIGVQGLADLFAILRLPWESAEAIQLNRELTECMYFHFLKASCNMSKELGRNYGCYSTNGGSHIKNGIFHFELWDKNNTKANEWMNSMEYLLRTDAGRSLPKEQVEEFKKIYKPHRGWQLDKVPLSGRHDWESLRQEIAIYGTYNSLGLGFMPTASTAQICGNNEGFEPYQNLVMNRITLAGEFPVVVKHLVEELKALNLWSPQMAEKIRLNDGSIQNIEEIPKDIKEIYKTAFEIKRTTLVEMSRDRQIFIDQSQSFSMFFDVTIEANGQISLDSFQKLSNFLVHTWEMGLITGIYYNRMQRRKNVVKFSMDSSKMKEYFSSGTEKAIEEPRIDKKRKPDIDEPNQPSKIQATESEDVIESKFLNKRKFDDDWDKIEESNTKIEVCTRGNPNCSTCQ